MLGAGLMKLLDWFGDSGYKGKIESIFRFLKDWWPVLVAGLMALFPGVALIPGLLAITIGFLPILDNFKTPHTIVRHQHQAERLIYYSVLL